MTSEKKSKAQQPGKKDPLNDEVASLKKQLADAQRSIDKLRIMEEALRQSESRYRSLLENMQDGVFIVQESKTLFVNEAFARMVGYSVDQALGRPFTDFVIFDERDFVAETGTMVEHGSRQHNQYSFHLLHRDGKTKIPAINTIGTFIYLDKPAQIGTVKDITSLRKGEEERTKLEEQLRHVQKMDAIGTLAGGVAHDMNNVLGAIMAVASVLREESDEADPRIKDIEDILSATRRGRDLTRDLLGFARKGKFRKENLSIGGVVQGVRALLSRTIPKNIEIAIEGEDKKLVVQGDFGQLSHALMNICINAAEAMPGGGDIAISMDTAVLNESDLAAWPDLQAGEFVLLKVSDTGIGIDLEQLEQVFDPFYTTKPLEDSSGLGLSMVYGTVRNHGGTVTIKSEIGVGTEVCLYLPKSESPEAIRRPSGQYQTVPRDGSGVILLVDDEAMIRRSAARMIELLGHKVLVAGNGMEAIEIFEKRRYEISVVILDLVMPAMDGEETFYRLRAIDPNIPVIISSGFTREGKAKELLKAGASGFVQKPFDIEAFAAEVLEVINDD